MRKLAVVGLIHAAVCAHAWGQATVTFTPASLSFDLTNPQAQTVTIALSTGQVTFVNFAVPAGVTITGAGVSGTQLRTGEAYTVSVPLPCSVPFGTTSSQIAITGPQGSDITGANLPITFTGNCTGTGTGNFSASVTSIQLTPADPARQITLFSSTGTIPTYFPQVAYTSGTSTGWLTTNPALLQATNSNLLTVSLATVSLPAGTYTANLILTPSAAGFTPITIPVTLTVGGGGNSVLSANPTSLTFTYNAGQTTPLQQSTTVSGPAGVTYSISLSQNLSGVMTLSANSGTGTITLTATLQFPSQVTAGTSGSITLTPTSGSNLNPYVIPVTINPGSGGGVTIGILRVAPDALSFTGISGGQATAPQELNVTSTDQFQPNQLFNVSSQAPGITVQVANQFTPSRIIVTANPGSLAPGTYTGTVDVVAFSGIGAGFPIRIPITFRVLPNVTITPNPNSVTMTARTGQTTAVTRDVTLNLSASGTDIPYTATATTSGGGNWLSVTPASGVGIPSTLTVSANAQGLAIGTYNGEVVLATGGTNLVTIPVALTVVPSGTMAITPNTLTFNYRTIDTSAPAAQNIEVTSTSGGPALNWNAVATTNTGGNWLTATASGTTPGTVAVSVNPTGLQPGTYTGRVRITSAGATNSPQDVAVTLNVTAPAVPQLLTFLNSASFTQTPVSPGLIFTIQGMDLGPAEGATATVTDNRFPTTLGGARVLFDGTPAPLLYASASQINGVVPFDVATRPTVMVRVERDGVPSAERQFNVRATSPGLYTLNASGTGQVAAINQDGTVNSPSNPAPAGSIIVLYGTGLGTTTPEQTTGAVTGATPPYPRFSNLVQVRVGGVPAEILYAGPAPGFVAGGAQFNIRIPNGTQPGTNVYVQVEAGGVGSENLTTISVR